MPIPVICPGCKARFTVGDQFAGRTGPCPKCKAPITIPKPAVQSVVIHEPEPAAASAASGRAPTAPIRRRDKPVPIKAFAATAAGVVVFMGLALVYRLMFPPDAAFGAAAASLLLLGGFAAAVPCVLLGYAAVRNRELEPYQGRTLLLRSLACAGIYATLWGIRGLIPWMNPSLPLNDMYQWFMIGPLFVAAGGLTALATLDLEWGAAAFHYSFYVLFTALLRWIAGLQPL